MSKREIKKPQKSINKGNKRFVKKQDIKKEAKIKVELTYIEKLIDKYSFGILLFLIFSISLFVFRDFIFLKKVFLFKDIGSDTINENLADLIHFRTYYLNEGFFKWSFFEGMGQSIGSGFNPGILIYPPLYFIWIILSPDNLAFGIIYNELFKIGLTGIIAYLFLKEIGLSKIISILGAVMYCFSGFMIIATTWHQPSWTILSFIFLLFSFEKLMKGNNLFLFPLAIAYLGSLYYVYLLGVFFIIYAFLRFVEQNTWHTKKFVKLFSKVGLLGILGLLINSPIFVTNFLSLIQSPRGSGEASYTQSLNSISSFTLVDNQNLSNIIYRLFSNDLLGNGSNFKGISNYFEAPAFYIGLICLLILPQAFIILKKRTKLLYSILLGLFIIPLIFPYFRHALNLFIGDYYRPAYCIFFPFVLYYISIRALDQIYTYRIFNLKVFIATFIALILILFVPISTSDVPIIDGNIRNFVLFFLILYTILFAVLSKNQSFNTVFLVLCLSIIIESSVFASISINSRVTMTSVEYKGRTGLNDYSVDAVKFLNSIDSTFYRIEKDYSSGTAMHGSLNDSKAQGYFGTTSYSSANQNYYIKFMAATNIISSTDESQTRWTPGLRSRPLLQTIANVKYNLSKSEAPFLLNAGYSNIGEFHDVKVLKNNYYLPFGFTYDSCILSSKFKDLNNLQKDLMLLRACVIDDENPNLKTSLNKYNFLENTDTVTAFEFNKYKIFTDNLKKDTLQMTNFSHNKISGNITLSKDKLLFFSIPFDKAWTIKVDGKEEILQIANVGFMAVDLPKGEHQIELEFVPHYYYSTKVISGVGLVILLLLVSLQIRNYRKKKYSESKKIN